MLAHESAVETTDFRFFKAVGDVLKSEICLLISSNEKSKTRKVSFKLNFILQFNGFLSSCVNDLKILFLTSSTSFFS